MSGPFNAAIDSIRGYLRVMEAYPSKHEKDITESYAAIHILEAAGKVDKEVAWGELADSDIVHGLDGGLYDLLAALPDKEKP